MKLPRLIAILPAATDMLPVVAGASGPQPVRMRGSHAVNRQAMADAIDGPGSGHIASSPQAPAPK